MNNTPDSPAQTPDDRTDQGGNYWTLFTPGIWKALHAVSQSGARVDLLVTDVGLPGGMNGRQVADAARALRPGLQVLFITGYADNAAVGNGHLERGMQVMTKPFTMVALAAKVRAMLAEGSP